MLKLTSSALRLAPLINSAADAVYQIEFPKPYVPHVIEFCSPTLTGAWGAGKSIAVLYLGVDNFTRANSGSGDFTKGYVTEVPVLDTSGAALVITKNMQVPIAPPKSGVIVLRVTGALTDVHIAVSPINEGRAEHVLYLPSLQ